MSLPLTSIHSDALDIMCQKLTTRDGDHGLPQAKWENDNDTLTVVFIPRKMEAESDLNTPAEAVYREVVGILPGIRLRSCATANNDPGGFKVVMEFSYRPIEVEMMGGADFASGITPIYKFVRRFPVLSLVIVAAFLLCHMKLTDIRYWYYKWYLAQDPSASFLTLLSTFRAEKTEIKAYIKHCAINMAVSSLTGCLMLIILSWWTKVGVSGWYHVAIKILMAVGIGYAMIFIPFIVV
jgi:hypothetical protein